MGGVRVFGTENADVTISVDVCVSGPKNADAVGAFCFQKTASAFSTRKTQTGASAFSTVWEKTQTSPFKDGERRTGGVRVFYQNVKEHGRRRFHFLPAEVEICERRLRFRTPKTQTLNPDWRELVVGGPIRRRLRFFTRARKKRRRTSAFLKVENADGGGGA